MSGTSSSDSACQRCGGYGVLLSTVAGGPMWVRCVCVATSTATIGANTVARWVGPAVGTNTRAR